MEYLYNSILDYYSINLEKVNNLQQINKENQKENFYHIHLKYYRPLKLYYLSPPNEYINNLEILKQNKEDIFSKGKILTFTKGDFSFDAIVLEYEEYYYYYYDKNDDYYYEYIEYYCYILPIKKNYRKANILNGYYKVIERTGDLTYIRMKDALNEFKINDCCLHYLKTLIIGQNLDIEEKNLNYLFNFDRYYRNNLKQFISISRNQTLLINNIFKYELNTIELTSNTDKKIICFIVNEIFRKRKNKKDKILICTPSNIAADKIALDLMEMNYFINSMNLLRIYAKNQENVKRNENLKQITFHILKKNKKQKKLIKNSDIIISTCVNSYCDELINCKFPFVIIADANNASESESLIPITLKAKHLTFISYNDDNGINEINMYKRMKNLYHNSHIKL